MMERIECHSAEEVYAAVEQGKIAVVVVGDLELKFLANQYAVLDGPGLKSAHVVAWGSAHVEAWESAHVVAWGSAHVEAWESAHVVAWESAHVEARESAHVEAGKLVTVHQHSGLASVSGGVIVRVEQPKTTDEWLDFYGLGAVDGTVVLYKAVDDEFRSPYGMLYVPGSIPVAPDWDGGIAECGGGLHFSPRPTMAQRYAGEAPRFVACPVRVQDIVVHPDAQYPDKVKAPGCAAAVWEVDRYGNEVKTEEAPTS